MAVQAASLEVLEKANVPAAQARAIVQAIEIELMGARDTLATKQDFWELKAEFASLRGDIDSKLARFQGVIDSKLARLQGDIESRIGDIDGKIAGLRAGIESRIGDVDGKITGLRGAVDVDLATLEGRLRAEIHVAVSGSTRQMYGALLAQMAVLLGIAYFFVAHLPR